MLNVRKVINNALLLLTKVTKYNCKCSTYLAKHTDIMSPYFSIGIR